MSDLSITKLEKALDELVSSFADSAFPRTAVYAARHQLTDYEKLLKKGQLTREEARDQVQPRINAIIAAWRRPREA